MTEVEFSQKVIELIPDIITGRRKENELSDLYCNHLPQGVTPLLDTILDARIKNNETIDFYSNVFARQKDILNEAGIEIDYSFQRMTEMEWLEHNEWQREFIYPYLLTTSGYILYKLKNFFSLSFLKKK
jgi:hypothetical protein